MIGIVLLDTIQARIFKHSPIISWKEELPDDDSWVDRGIIIDTYYCTREKDIQTVSWQLKNSKFTCPVDNIQIKKFINYDFSITESSNTKHEKIFAFNYENNDFYYGNTNFELSLYENDAKNVKYNIETSLKNGLITFDDILKRAKNIELHGDIKSSVYKYNNFNVIVCNTVDEKNDVIIGDDKMKIENYCK